MRKKHFITLATALSAALASCSDADDGDASILKKSDTTQRAAAITMSKASAIAHLFAPYRSCSNDEVNTNKSVVATGVTSTSVHTEGSDTLFYAFNYGDADGYVIVSANATNLPVVAQSDKGHIDFDSIDSDSPFLYYIKAQASSATAFAEPADSSIWDDLGNEEYEYEVSIGREHEETCETMNKSRYRVSEGLATIFPHTGMALTSWTQGGDYNSAVDGKAIGCPAIAIGMLLYDITHRMDGTYERTNPQFRLEDKELRYAKEVSARLKQIADKIQGYKFTSDESGAPIGYVADYLRHNGFPEIAFYDFNVKGIHASMTKKARDQRGTERTYRRGLLLWGQSREGKYHIWFCDGYEERSYTITKRRRITRRVIKRWTEYEHRLYMNWGQHSHPDGWYSTSGNVVDGGFYNNELKYISGLFTYKMPSE